MNRLRSLPRLLLSAFLVLGAWPIPAMAAVPPTFSYQGNLWQNSIPVNATQTMTFRITDASGAVQYWSSGALPVAVTRGNFKVDLNPAGVSWDAITPYIEVTVAGAVLLPREPLNSVPYALMAASAEGAAQLASTSAWSAQQTFLNRVAVSSDLAVAGTLNRTADLSVGGPGYSVAFASGVTAGWFYGNGAGLTGITAALPANGVTTDTNQGVSGVKTFISTLTVSAQDASGYSLKLSSGLNMPAGTVTAGFLTSNGAIFNGNLSISGANSVLVSSGIAAAPGSAGLFVSTSLYVSGTLYGNGAGLTGLAGADSTKVAKTGDEMTGQLTLSGSTLTVTGNAFSVGGSTLVVTNGNVGIGTTSPIGKLHVSGAGDMGLRLESTDGTRARINLSSMPSAGWQLEAPGGIGNSPAGTFGIVESGVANRLTIQNITGNVGIGTASPAAKLDVAGSAQFGSGAAKSTFSATGALTFPAGYTPSAALDAANKGYVDSQVSAGGVWTKTGSIVELADSADNAVVQSTLTVQGNAFSVGGSTLVVTNGNVGIGTTNPNAALQVSGAAVVGSPTGGNMGSGSINASAVYVNGAVLSPGTGSNWTVSGADIYRSGGNVGIGTTSPSAPLVVAGSPEVQNGFDGLLRKRAGLWPRETGEDGITWPGPRPGSATVLNTFVAYEGVACLAEGLTSVIE